MNQRVFTLLSMAFILTILTVACKHEIPNDPGGGTVPGGGSGSGGGTGGGAPNPQPSANCSPDTAYFQQQVLPIFISNCSMSGCHDAASHQDGVILTSYSSIILTGDVRPFQPNNSDVWERITETNLSKRMPPAPRPALTQSQKDIIFKWIMQGARNNSCQSSACDSTNVGFNATIKPIISNKCAGCHSGAAPSGGYDLTQYAVVKARVTDGKLWGAINHNPGFSPMPKNGSKLSDCEIGMIKKWINSGAPNN